VAVTLSGGSDAVVRVGGVNEDTIKNVENVYGGSGADTLGGDSLANQLQGGAGNDLLAGGGGADLLRGQAGADTFLFNTAPNAVTNLDHIKYLATEDTIQLENGIFTALTTTGTLAAEAFYSAAGATSAHDSTDRIVYNTTTGGLYYDADGSGGAASVEFAVLDNHAALTNADFIVV
jgi:Ca2+-binding RTX toxin-like protein